MPFLHNATCLSLLRVIEIAVFVRARYTLNARNTAAKQFFARQRHCYPAPGRRRGIVIERFLSLFVSLSARLRKHGWTDLHEIFREGVE